LRPYALSAKIAGVTLTVTARANVITNLMVTTMCLALATAVHYPATTAASSLASLLPWLCISSCAFVLTAYCIPSIVFLFVRCPLGR
jgi:hypothetical protein